MPVLTAATIAGVPDASWVAIDGTTIVGVGDAPAPPDATDLGDAILAPGFIDVQCNGISDIDFSGCSGADVDRARDLLLSSGVTTVLPTVVTRSLDDYDSICERLSGAADGIHLEGPFLRRPGAHRRDLLRDADTGWVRSLLDAHPGLIRMVTLAPEADPDLALTRMLRDEGVIVSIGHSDATFDQAIASEEAGATGVTHLYNAMSGLHHRDPGVVGAALDDDRLTPTLIADLVHVHPAALRLAASRKRNVALITDAVGIGSAWAAGRVEVRDGAPRLQDGTLAGSVLRMDRAIANLVSIGIDADRAIEMATAIPAELLGLGDRGRIAPGLRADLVALDPETFEVRAVWREGHSHSIVPGGLDVMS